MSVAAIRTAIVARLASVADIGVVHDRERYAADHAGLKALYWSPTLGQLRGWHVRRQQTTETGELRQNSVEHVRWRLVGIMTFDDAASSELAFDALIERIRDAFRADDTLDGTVAQCSLPAAGGGSAESAIQLDDCGPAMFAGVLCHVARLSLNTIRYLE